jgi:hypothetical protein
MPMPMLMLMLGFRWCLTVCTGSAILAKTGVLDGKRATSNKKAFAWVCMMFRCLLALFPTLHVRCPSLTLWTAYDCISLLFVWKLS